MHHHMIWSSTERARRDDGAILVVTALSITALLIVVALVVDLSFVRNTRQDSKRTTDAVASAGIQSLVEDGEPYPWRAACTALSYLRANQPERTFDATYRDGEGTIITVDPCSSDPLTSRLDDVCDTGGYNTSAALDDRSTWAHIQATADGVVVDIEAGYVTPNADFPEDMSEYSGDDADPDQGFCDQLGATVREGDEVFFGGIVGQTGYDSATRTVARVVIEQGDGVPAFLMLERTKCAVLVRSNYVGAGDGIIVEPGAGGSPGIIHTDSKGSSGCTGGPEDSFTVYSTPIGSNPGIWAKDGSSEAGILSLQAIEAGNPGTAVATDEGVYPDGRSGRIVSRRPVDDKYQPETTIAGIHALAYNDAIRTSTPDGYTRLECTDKTGAFVGITHVFVDCSEGYSPDAITFTDATHVIFNGPVQVGNNQTLFMPKARRVVVGGDGTRGLEVSGGGQLGINSIAFTDSDLGVDAACDGRTNPSPDLPTVVSIFGGGNTGTGAGALNVGGRAALCQSFIYLAGPKTPSNSSYNYQAVVDDDGNSDPSCTAEKPCPRDGVLANGHFDITGYLRLSAPNQYPTSPAPDDSVGVEDLAIWTESSTLSQVKSGGIARVDGVLFFPNADVEMRSPASANPQDSQFIARRLKLFAGTLKMQPTENNSVPVPFLASLGLVR